MKKWILDGNMIPQFIPQLTNANDIRGRQALGGLPTCKEFVTHLT
ncbi:MAG TPA: hypothetical protein VIP70_12540 [Nitrososphaeraceae archaeon]